MSDLFTSDEWMARFKDEWNNEPGLSGAWKDLAYSNTFGFGFLGEDNPRCVVICEEGIATYVSSEVPGDLAYDIRAAESDWIKWGGASDAYSLHSTLGAAFTGGKLKFLRGDYAALVRDPRLALPFYTMFLVIGRA